MTTLTIIVTILLIISIILIICLYQKLNHYKNTKVSMPNELLQKLFDIMGDKIATDEKIEKLNKAILNTYESKYSSIVLFDGNKNNVKASNVENTFLPSIANIANDYIFKSNIHRNTAKYITVDNEDTLLYTSAIERKIRSTLFIPIYHNNSYLGYILLEDDNANKFEHISTLEMDHLKTNIGVFLENINYQSTIEIAESVDKQTGFFNNMYLYSNARNVLNEYDNSAIVLVYLKNLPDINEKYNRNIGNALLIKLANVTKEVFPKQTILIRYSGLRFLILIPGYTAEKSHSVLERLLSRYKSEFEFFGDEKVVLDTQIVVHTFRRQNNIESEVQRMSSGFDRIKDVNVIKIV
ncbi:MAG: diguanylate cyclase [Clostridia bacterium]|nr:diguanylate cyclase [Clostridia bacterium]